MKNNLIIFVGVFLLTMIGSSIYTQITQNTTDKSGKVHRLPCHESLNSFERGYDNKAIKIAQDKLSSGDVTFSSYVEKSVYAPSKLFDYIKLSDIDKITQKELDSYSTTKSSQGEKLKVVYYIYENDIGDPGKKTKKSKLYAGYVVFKFYNQPKRLIYQSQIDFMDKKGGDIAQSIKCAIKSFATFNKN